MSLNVIPLTGSIGAVVGGVDLNKPVDKETFEHLHKAFLQHCVLVFRDQGIGPEAQTAFGKLWGEPAQQGNPLLKDLFVTPEIIKITKIPKETASTEAWHYDSCYTPVPPKISILAAVTVPRGGDTMWCNQYEAYDRLSPTMQRMIQAGATPISVLGLACELQRDWGRPDANRLRVIMREYFSNLRNLKA